MVDMVESVGTIMEDLQAEIAGKIQAMKERIVDLLAKATEELKHANQ